MVGILSDDGTTCCIVDCGLCGGVGCADVEGVGERDTPRLTLICFVLTLSCFACLSGRGFFLFFIVSDSDSTAQRYDEAYLLCFVLVLL